MNKLTLLLTFSLLSANALAGVVSVEVPEPGMLGLFATAGAALFLLRKFKK